MKICLKLRLENLNATTEQKLQDVTLRNGPGSGSNLKPPKEGM